MDALVSIFTDTSRLHHRYHHTIFESFNLHRGQAPLLNKLAETDGISQKELANRMNISPATLTRMVQNMEKNGLVKRHTDLHDQRITIISLTTKGIEVRAQIKEKMGVIDEKIFKNFSTNEKDNLKDMLLRIQTQLKQEINNENNN